MSRRLKKFFASTLTLLMVLSVFGYSAPGTNAFYSDVENSTLNNFSAGSLDLQLVASASWSPVTAGADPLDFFPGDVISRTLRVENVGTLDFSYTASVSHTFTPGTPDLCQLLNLQAFRTPPAGGETSVYNGPLLGLSETTPIGAPYALATSSNDKWRLEVSLPSGLPEENDDLSCEGFIAFDSFILPLSFGQGFHDRETLNGNIFESGGWVIPTDNYSPIADARIQENQPTNNYGSAVELHMRNQVGASQESFLKFDLNLPSSVTINSATLNLFMHNAPNVTSRPYGAHRVNGLWTEPGITWNSSPSYEAIATDVITSGITNGVWLAWNVQPDVQGFVAGSLTNNGWGLRDESPFAPTTGEFRSQEASQLNQRPVLEVNFTAPPATTTHLVVNEVHFNTASGSDGANEWVELYNPTDLAVDLTGWQICDSSACDTFPGTPSIPAKGFAVIANNPSTWNVYWTQILATGATVIPLGPGNPIGNQLANGGDSVILRDSSAVVVDAMSYGSDTTQLNPSVPLSGDGDSLARVIKGYDANLATDWLLNATPNPGTNPSASGAEVMRFTYNGVMIADASEGLDPLLDEEVSEGEEEEPVVIEETPMVTPILEPDPASSSEELLVTPTPTPSPEETPLPTSDPSETPDPTPTPSPTSDPEPDPSVTPTPEVSPSVTPEPSTTPTPSVEPDPTPEVSPTPEPTPTPTDEPEPSLTPTPSVEPEPTQDTSPSPSPEPTASPEPTPEIIPAPTPEPDPVIIPDPPQVVEIPSAPPIEVQPPAPIPDPAPTGE